MNLDTSERRDLLLTMVRSGRSDLRDRALRTGAETLPIRAIIELLRDEADDVARNSALEMLKLRGRRSFSTAVSLLADHDPDVVLQAVLLLDDIGDPRAWPHLRPLLRHADVNVVQAVITASGHLGSTSAAAEVIPFLSGDSWLQAAALAALGQLRAREAVPAIAVLLADSLLGELAAEALARIGGDAAASAIVDHWSQHEQELDAKQWLPLIAQSLGETESLLDAESVRARLARHLITRDREVSVAAAESLLALGPGDDDGAALEIVLNAEVSGNAAPALTLPRCLARRFDLAEYLLGSGVARDWGYELYRRGVHCIAADVVQRVIVEHPPARRELLSAMVERVGDTATLIALYLGHSSTRDLIAPLLRARAAEVRDWLDRIPEIDREGRLLLMDGAGVSLRQVAKEISRLDIVDRVKIVSELRSPGTLTNLPWAKWVEEDRDTFARLLGDVTARCAIDELMPLVRYEIKRDALPELVACAGAMQDENSLPLIIGALAGIDASARGDLFEAIAAIGGVAARDVLHRFATCGDRVIERLAAVAMAQHATAEDCAILRTLAASSDWAIRYQAAGALGQFPQLENLETLTILAADPTAVVAHRARGWLNAVGSGA